MASLVSVSIVELLSTNDVQPVTISGRVSNALLLSTVRKVIPSTSFAQCITKEDAINSCIATTEQTGTGIDRINNDVVVINS